MNEQIISITEFDKVTRGYKTLICVAGTEHYLQVSKAEIKEIMRSGFDYAKILIINDWEMIVSF